MSNSSDVRAMSPVSFQTQSLRALINGNVGPVPSHLPPLPSELVHPTPSIGALDLSGFAQYHTPGPSLTPPPPAKRPCGIVVPPRLPPLPDAPQATSMPAASSQASRIPFPGPHAGLMRPYGGIKRWMAMQRGEIPWPSEEELKDLGG